MRSSMFVFLLTAVCFGLMFDLPTMVQAQPATGDASETAEMLPESLRPTDFDARDITAANTVVQSLNVTDWLGPLAPVALSPFFGLACLSGMSIWGPSWLADNALLSAAGPLKSPTVFGVFVLLTLLTSIPRLTKVSKPFAQAVDQLESYSVIVILLAIKLFAGGGVSEGGEPVESLAMVQMGMFSFTAQTLLAMAMVVNLFVINSVKFFFEVLIWLTPIPAVDAMFEIANKAVCAGLMSLYAFSPTLATVVNLAMLLAALIVFRWVRRRLTFYRSMLIDFVLSRLWPAFGEPKSGVIVGFVKQGEGPFSAKTRWQLVRKSSFDDSAAEGTAAEGTAAEGQTGSWTASQWGLMGTSEQELQVSGPPRLRCGWVMHTLELDLIDSSSPDQQTLHFHVSRRFDGQRERWCEQCGIELTGEEPAGQQTIEGMKAEFV